MTVWIVTYAFPYEGFDIEGVYGSVEAAERAAAAKRKELSENWDVDISEWDVL